MDIPNRRLNTKRSLSILLDSAVASWDDPDV